MPNKKLHRPAKKTDSGFISLTLVLVLTASLSSMVFGLIELNVPYLHLKKSLEIQRSLASSAVACRNIIISHLHENAGFDVLFAEPAVSDLFKDIKLPGQDTICSVMKVEQAKVIDIAVGDISVVSEGYKAFIIETIGMVPSSKVGSGLRIETSIVFDQYMKIIFLRSIEI